MDLVALQLVWANAQSKEELEASLQHHGITAEDLKRYAEEHGWEPGPYVLKHVAATGDVSKADAEYIENANRSQVRKLQEYNAIVNAKLQAAISDPDIPIGALLGLMEDAIKNTRELVRLENPLWGLSTVEPPGIGNPINIFMADEHSSDKTTDESS